jgi:hypothetical protein
VLINMVFFFLNCAKMGGGGIGLCGEHRQDLYNVCLTRL